MTLLALDLGTKTGWAYGWHEPVSGTLNLAGSRFEGGGMRFLRFRQWLETWGESAARPDRIVFEEVRRHRGTDAAHIYGGLLATLTAWCEQEGVPYEGVGVGQIKKFATGKGNADKGMMIAAMKARGFSPKDDNEADALALWLMKKGE